MSSLWRQFSDLEFQLRLSLPIAMIALQCLVAIWAATSKTHWFWRALAVWAAIMLLMPINAWEPAWMFGLSSPLIIGVLVASRWIKSRFAADPAVNELPRKGIRWRFSLRDLLLLVLIIALWLPALLEIGRHFRPSNWVGWLV